MYNIDSICHKLGRQPCHATNQPQPTSSERNRQMGYSSQRYFLDNARRWSIVGSQKHVVKQIGEMYRHLASPFLRTTAEHCAMTITIMDQL